MDTIDTIDDLLQSDRQLMLPGDTLMKSWVENDPRESVQDLNRAKQIKYFYPGVHDGVTVQAVGKE